MLKYLATISILLIALDIHAQLSDEHEYAKEFTWGANKNTNSGLIAREGRAPDKR